MKRSVGAAIAKIAVGAIFIAAMFRTSDGEEPDRATVFVGGVIGLALIVWAIISVEKAKIEDKAAKQAKKENAERLRITIEAEKKAAAEKPKYCTHCGAATKGTVCEYCGSPLDD